MFQNRTLSLCLISRQVWFSDTVVTISPFSSRQLKCWHCRNSCSRMNPFRGWAQPSDKTWKFQKKLIFLISSLLPSISIKVRQLGVRNWIVHDSDSKPSKFRQQLPWIPILKIQLYRRFWFRFIFDVFSIKFDLFSINFDHFLISFRLKDKKDDFNFD